VIVLISKPPAPAIARRIEEAAAAAGKPVVIHFLGARPEQARAGVSSAGSLREAADLAVAIARGQPERSASETSTDGAFAAIEQRARAMAPTQKGVRGLFTGGTFCYEAQLAFIAHGLACSSNAPAKGATAFDGRFDGHVFLDLGDDDYTRGRPHPMIDPMLRDAAVRTQGADPQTAAILFDVVLGFGSHADPAAGLARALTDAGREAAAQGRTLAMIGHVCGTDGDPQNKAAQVRQLEDAGAVIVGSNVEAAVLAAHLATRLVARPGESRR
jgi:hypothetical protein